MFNSMNPKGVLYRVCCFMHSNSCHSSCSVPCSSQSSIAPYKTCISGQEECVYVRALKLCIQHQSNTNVAFLLIFFNVHCPLLKVAFAAALPGGVSAAAQRTRHQQTPASTPTQRNHTPNTLLARRTSLNDSRQFVNSFVAVSGNQKLWILTNF